MSPRYSNFLIAELDQPGRKGAKGDPGNIGITGVKGEKVHI